MDAPSFAPGFVSGFLPTPPDGDAVWIPYRGGDLLVKMEEPRRGRLLRTADLAGLSLPVVRSQYVGTLDGVACIAAELAEGAPELDGHRYAGLRVVHSWLAQAEFSAASLGFQVQYWDRSHRFCPGCGQAISLKEKERAKHCSSCERDFYPPVVPAIIVRIERGDSILMTRQSRFPKGMYGLVAGFVEAGETLEGCVEREVLEETGVRVKNIRYFGSQPWPFPHQMMVGFTAEHASGDIVVDTNELEEARWFDRNAMPMLPPSISIARQLVDDWLGH